MSGMRHTRAVFQHQPDQALRDYDLVQARNVRMCELAMVVDLTGEVGVVLLRRLEHDLRLVSDAAMCGARGGRVPRTLEPLLSLCDAR